MFQQIIPAGYDNIRDVGIAALLVVVGVAYIFRDKILSPPSSPASPPATLPNAEKTTTAVQKPATGTKKKSRDFIKVMQNNGKNVVIFYGSQTGTAEDYANRLAKDAAAYGLSAMTADLEDYDLNNLDRITSDQLVIFTMATYGEGEPTDNALEFWEFLFNPNAAEEVPEFSKAINGDSVPNPDKPLEDLNYVVFGLGNKTYEHYNAVARNLDKRMQQLGATRIGERGEGDDDGNLEEDFLAWRELIWEDIKKHMKLDMEKMSDQLRPLQYNVEVKFTDPTLAQFYFKGEMSAKGWGERASISSSNAFLAKVRNIKPLFQPDCDRDCIHLEVDISGKARYSAGDHIAIYPINTEEEVLRIARYCGIADQLTSIIEVINNDETGKRNPFPCPTTYLHALRHYMEIASSPSRQLVGIIAKYLRLGKATAASEWLSLLGSDKELYAKEVLDNFMTVGRLLEKAEKVQRQNSEADAKIEIPFALLVESLGRLQPRYYSISSSAKVHNDHAHVTAVVQQKLSDNGSEAFYGLCTNFLLHLQRHVENSMLASPVTYWINTEMEELMLPVYIRSSNFKLPRDPKVPVIMVGPGTGVAPFRGFVQERAWQVEQGMPIGTTLLFYGCRRRDQDFLYQEELFERMNNSSTQQQHELVLAFSREPNQRKVYVQHRITERAELLWDLLSNKKAYFYVCGDAKNMARAVNQTLIDMAIQLGSMDSEKATNWVKRLRAAGRYQEDVWS